MKPLLVREKLLSKKLAVFSPMEFQRLFDVSHFKAKYFLERQTREGLFIRLKKGLYTLKTDQPSEEEVANRLYRPSYISFEYALSKYNLIPEMVYEVTSATTKPTRIFSVSGRQFIYLTIKKEAYTGYSFKKELTKSYLIAEPEKALADYLYFVALGKKKLNDRLKLAALNKDKLVTYARLYKRKKLVDLLGKYL